MKLLKRQIGVTLLETMLVLAIISALLVLSVKMYRQYQTQLYVEQLQANVDSLFAAMAIYYQTNCFGRYNSSGAISTWGKLNPSASNPTPPSTSSPKVVSIATDLIATGYLNNWQPLNPIVNNADNGEQGYFVQFNPIIQTVHDINACTNMSTTPCTVTTQAINYAPNDEIESLTWEIQVSVELNDPTTAQTYSQLLGATCISTLNGSTIDRCEKPPSAQNGYLVWERMPSKAVPNNSTLNWTFMPIEKQNLLQYTHDAMYELIPSTTDTNGNALRYYLCGG